MSISAQAAAAWTNRITEAGVLGYVKRISGYGAVDFITSIRSSDTLVETDLLSIVTDYETDRVDGTLIQGNDLKIICDSSVAISKDNTLKIGTDIYQIVSIRKVNFAGILVGYVLQART